jgi:competence protein ComEC
MTRILPAHVVAAALALGLAGSNAVRLGFEPLAALVAVGALAITLGAPRSMHLASVALLAVGAGWWWGGVRLDALDRSPLRAEVDRSARALVEVTGEARVGQFGQRLPGRVRRFDGRALDERVELDLPLGRAPPQGALVSLLAVVRLPPGPSNGFDDRAYLRRQGIHVVLKVDEWHDVGRRGGIGGVGDRLRRWLRRASAPGLTGERRAVLEGVLLGDDNGLSPALQTSFRRSGLYHLLAVSGQNVVLLAGGVLGLGVLLGAPRAWGHVGTLAAIGAYVLAVGPQASVIRAAVAGAAVSIAWLGGRERDPWHVLLVAAVVLLAWSPYTAFDPGFQLSFVAVLAIFIAAGRVTRVLEGYPVPRTLAMAVAISAVCSLATTPILWLQFGSVPLLGVIANALVEPAIGPLLGLALVTAAVDPVSPPLAATLAWANGWIAAYVAACARLIAAVPFAQANGPAAALAGIGALAFAASVWIHERRRAPPMLGGDGG